MAKRKAKAKSGAFVLDGSITLTWFFADEADAYAESVEDALASAVVPSLWPLEVADALLMGERRKRTTEAKVTQFVALLTALPITIDDETAARAWQESLHLARAHQLTAYNAAYLELRCAGASRWQRSTARSRLRRPLSACRSIRHKRSHRRAPEHPSGRPAHCLQPPGRYNSPYATAARALRYGFPISNK